MNDDETIVAWLRRTLPERWSGGLQIVKPPTVNLYCWFAFAYIDGKDIRWIGVDFYHEFHIMGEGSAEDAMWDILRRPEATVEEVVSILDEDKLRHRLEEL